MSDRGSSTGAAGEESSYGGVTHEGGSSYAPQQRGTFGGGSLPPSGPMAPGAATQGLWAGGPPDVAAEPTATTAATSSGDGGTPKASEETERTASATSSAGGDVAGLNNLGTLQNALPEVSGGASE